MPYKNKKKQAAYQRRWEKQDGYSRQRGRRAAVRKKLWEYKKTVACIKCGESHPACIEFHHPHPKLKHTEVAEMPMRGYSWQRILQEIEKCIVLCRNCHAKLHWPEGTFVLEPVVGE